MGAIAMQIVELVCISFFMILFLRCRLNTAQIPCPEPIMLRSHVLLMGFIGKGDRYVSFEN